MNKTAKLRGWQSQIRKILKDLADKQNLSVNDAWSVINNLIEEARIVKLAKYEIHGLVEYANGIMDYIVAEHSQFLYKWEGKFYTLTGEREAREDIPAYDTLPREVWTTKLTVDNGHYYWKKTLQPLYNYHIKEEEK